MTKAAGHHPTELDVVLARHGRDRLRLVQILREAQEIEGWIPPETVAAIARALDIGVGEVESTLEFYSFFYRRPRGAYVVLFSDNITDRMLGNRSIFDHLARRFGVRRGEVSSDGLVSLDYCSCTGLCDQGPAILVNGVAIPKMTLARADQIHDLIRSKVPITAWPKEFFQIDHNIRRADMLLGSPFVPGSALKAAIAMGPEAFLVEVKRSNLRGRGGAGFTTGVKWEAAKKAQGDERFIVCNADEGEPGTFKDRVLMQYYPERVIEGMALAGFVTGARSGLIYLRGEYLYLKTPLEEKFAELRAGRLLGRNILGVEGFDFDVEIHMGAGAYICGEETALIESLEGKAGRPRIRPPFPVVCGYKNKPTVVNNVETLCKVTEIALQGGATYEGYGTKQSTGTKILSVSGDVERPGIYEFPFGVRVNQVLDEAGARNPKAVQISGASGACLGIREFGRRVAFEDVPTAGAFMVFGEDRDMFEVARNFAHFFAHESCGFCTPCRVGTAIQAKLMDKIANGHGTQYEMAELTHLREVMRAGSHCGLGQTAGAAIADTIGKFREDYEKRLAHKDFEPAFDLDAALARARSVSGRDDAASHILDHA
ncbi:MAG: NAD(P)H-dependent oxidoreductase subunit E [Hyphomicrobiales bacterium]|nr:NAD(P)H-dependent oxidoreductase subunit E [Hyphomicrobiales bacterium]